MRPKRFGYGAGFPIAWQGWALMGAFVMSAFALTILTHALARMGSFLALMPAAALLASVIWFVRTCARHTRGGWHWRWGDND